MPTSHSHRQILYGLTADRHFLELLNQPSISGTVEQVFNKAINISIDNSLYSLICSQLDNAPNSCRLINKDFSLLNIKEGDSFYLTEQCFYIGNQYSLSFALCKEWQITEIEFIKENAGEKRYQSFLENQIHVLEDILSLEKNSLFHYQGENVFYLNLAERLQRLRTDLITALQQEEHQHVMNAICQLIGLGIGLTPSGDDYLVGLMAILLLKNHPTNQFHTLFYQGIAPNLRQTTPISAITLTKALNYQYRENLHQLIQLLVDAKETNIYPQYLAILNIGSSSGCDMLFGIRDALYLTHYFGEKYVD